MEQFEEQLQNLWQQGGRDIALSFLRRAVNMDMPLGKLVAALNFADVNRHLGTITLRDILTGSGAARPGAAAEGAGPGQPVGAAAGKTGGRRRRRSADELAAMQKALLDMLRDEPGSLNTTQMVTSLNSDGHDIDSMRINAMLRALGSEGLVSDLGGKPKSWRATSKLRQPR